MPDPFSPTERSRIMRAVKSGDTKPEMIVRRLVHGLGYRYRLHVRSLPGAPDLVLPRLSTVILVHGCFWHRHRCAAGRSMPATRVEYWVPKFERTERRDRANVAKLRRDGWRVLTVWECETTLRRREKLLQRLERFLNPCA
ncbi:very short patch repair endonuclease [Pirellulales bacterium]|nr:very short patch repair endonuclease [Pirellulales bacterium]